MVLSCGVLLTAGVLWACLTFRPFVHLHLHGSLVHLHFGIVGQPRAVFASSAEGGTMERGLFLLTAASFGVPHGDGFAGSTA
jgi:hypothetical protein